MTNNVERQQDRMPGRLKGVLAILIFQILANVLVGFLFLDLIQEEESHGVRIPNAGLFYFLIYFTFALVGTMLICVVLTPRRLSWIRPTIITIEAIAVISGVINLAYGQLGAVIGIGLAIGAITMVNRDDVRGWFVW